MKLFDKELFKVRGINVQTFSLHNLEINWSELDTKPKRNTEQKIPMLRSELKKKEMPNKVITPEHLRKLT